MLIQVIGRKKSGKTTFCEHLIAHLKDIGHSSILAMKHSSNAYAPDDLSRDTGRLRAAGANASLFLTLESGTLISAIQSPWWPDLQKDMIARHEITVLEGDHQKKGDKVEVIADGAFPESFYATGEADGIVAMISNEPLNVPIRCFKPSEMGEFFAFWQQRSPS